MRRFWLTAAGVLGLAIMGYVGFMLWAAYGKPARPAWDYRVSAECEGVPSRLMEHKNGRLHCHSLIKERRLLKDNPDVAQRNGDTLTFYYAGQTLPVRQPITIVPGDPCDTVVVHKVLHLFDPSLRRKAALAQISCHNGEFESRALVLPDGELWPLMHADASQDGKTFAGSHLDSHFTLYDWPSRKVIVRFSSGCRRLKWHNALRIEVTCYQGLGDYSFSQSRPRAFDAVVSVGKNGRWRMQATRWLGGFEYNENGDLEFSPVFSLRWLPTYHPLPETEGP